MATRQRRVNAQSAHGVHGFMPGGHDLYIIRGRGKKVHLFFAGSRFLHVRQRLPGARHHWISHTAASWAGSAAIRASAAMPLHNSVARRQVFSIASAGTETLRGSSERLKTAA